MSGGESSSLMPSTKMTTPSRSSSSGTAGSSGKVVSFVGDGADQEMALYPSHPLTVPLYDLLVGNALYKDRGTAGMAGVLRKLRDVGKALTACAFRIG